MGETCAGDCFFQQWAGAQLMVVGEALQTHEGIVANLEQNQGVADQETAAQIDLIERLTQASAAEDLDERLSLIREKARGTYTEHTAHFDELITASRGSIEELKGRRERLEAARQRARETCTGSRRGALRWGELILHNHIARDSATCTGEIPDEFKRRA